MRWTKDAPDHWRSSRVQGRFFTLWADAQNHEWVYECWDENRNPDEPILSGVAPSMIAAKKAAEQEIREFVIATRRTRFESWKTRQAAPIPRQLQLVLRLTGNPPIEVAHDVEPLWTARAVQEIKPVTPGDDRDPKADMLEIMNRILCAEAAVALPPLFRDLLRKSGTFKV